MISSFSKKLFRKELRNNDAILKLVSFCPCPIGGLVEGRQGQEGGRVPCKYKSNTDEHKEHMLFLLLIGGINSVTVSWS